MSHSYDQQVISELRTALKNLHDACEYWEDQDDPVLKNAREAIKLSKNLPYGLKGFSCSKCGSNRLDEVCDNTTVSYEVIDVDEDGNCEYGFQNKHGGDFDRYQCFQCGHDAFFDYDKGIFVSIGDDKHEN